MSDIKLTDLQKAVLNFFGRHNFGSNFYWTGGTLLSYRYLRHRLSVDLDFFSDDLFSDDQYLLFINDLKKEVGAGKISLTLQYNRRLYLIERAGEALKTELVYFPFPATDKKEILPEFSVKIDSLSDIMTNKILSTYQRNEPKDVFDLYRYLSGEPKHDLSQLIGLAEKKFGAAIEPTLLIAKINALSEKLDLIKPLILGPSENLAKNVKSFFQEIFNSIVKKQLK